MIRRLLPILLSLLLLPDAPAQGIKTVLQSLSGAEKVADPDPSPEEQLAWAREQLEKLPDEEALANEVGPRLDKAGLPASTLEAFRVAAREARRNYQIAIDTLGVIVAGVGEAAPAKPVTPPANEVEAEAMRDALRREDLAARASEGEIEVLQRQIVQQQALSDRADVELRQLHEEISAAKDPAAAEKPRIESELTALQKQALESAIFAAKWKVAEQGAALKLSANSSDALRAALRTSGFDRQLDSRRADKQLGAIAQQTADSEKALAAAVKDQERAQEALAEIKSDPSAAGSQRLAAAQDLAAASQGLVVVLRGLTRILDIERAHWLTVKDLSGNPSPAGVRDALSEVRENLRLLDEWRPTMDKRLVESRENLDAAQRALKGAAAGPVRSTLEKALAAAKSRDAAMGALVSRVQNMAAMEEEFLSEVEALLGRETAPQRLARAWDGLRASAAAIWSFELFPAGGNSITVGKVALAAIGFALSLILAGIISRTTAGTAGRNFRLAEAQRSLVEKSVFVPAAALFVLSVLYWLNIPLTVFAFFGGALAIGVGFGVQNLMNNFISGIILLLERQIKVGDIIEVAGSTGRVTHLGSRCSRIRQFDGVELLVPNSAFLEKEVTNWTLADPHHRYDFPVGVAYGSPVEKVLDVLNSAVERQPEILRDPPPGVFFEAFGDSSLNFRIYYWLEMGGTVDPRQVGSDLRVRIERDFRAAGIEMPFPQRDLHLRSAATVRVRLEGPEAG